MMSFNDNRIAELIIKYWRTEITREEEQELEQWLESSPEHRQLFEDLSQEHDVNSLKNFEKNNPEKNKNYFNNTSQQPPESGKKAIPVSKVACWVFAAAAVAASILLLLGRNFTGPEHPPGLYENTVVLQLTDGTCILTDTIKNYLLIEQGRYQILVHKNEIRYLPLTGKPFKRQRVGYNEIKIPARKMFTVILPDESKVSLNALSSLRYVVKGAASSLRNVELMGEGYFEVKPMYVSNKKLPFVVKAKTAAGLSMDVTVKGTIFNINAYNESLINTTLLEGRIEVTANGENISLSAGEQLQVGAVIRQNKITSDDIINTVSWKDGFFSFRDAPVTDVIKEVNNWYGVKIELTEDIERKNYTGYRLPRSKDLDSVLAALCTALKCTFKIEGGRVLLIKK